MSTPDTQFSAVVRRIAGIISTDDILPARYKHATTDPSALAAHVFEICAPALAAQLAPSSVLVGDALFGIGSSREQAVTALLAAGVKAVIAPAFGRIFFRNAWNLALPALVVERAALDDGERVAVDLVAGRVEAVPARGGTPRAWQVPAVPDEVLAAYREGGLLAHLRRQLTGRDAVVTPDAAAQRRIDR